MPPATSQRASCKKGSKGGRWDGITHPLSSHHCWKDFAAVLLADVVSASHSHLPHQADGKLQRPIVSGESSVSNPAKPRDEEERKKRPSTAEPADDEGNGPAWDLDKGGEKVADEDVVRAQIGHVLGLAVVTHESHHAEIGLCCNNTVISFL